ncbi:MAG: hypothetical protein WC119_00755 [Synergistaceae bacterium]
MDADCKCKYCDDVMESLEDGNYVCDNCGAVYNEEADEWTIPAKNLKFSEEEIFATKQELLESL